MVTAIRPNERSAAMMGAVYPVTRSVTSARIARVVKMKTKIAVFALYF
jgi:hypothetical protein